MPDRQNVLLYLVGAAVILTVVSITAFEILMGLALLGLVGARTRLRPPSFWVPLALFLLGTLASLAASGQLREGIPQIRKFYIYLLLVLVTTVVQTVDQVWRIVRIWVLAAAVPATWSLFQFVRKLQAAHQAHRPFYEYYVGSRITGFTSHWMTFSGEMMIALLVISAAIFFGAERRRISWLTGAALLVTIALAAGWTRSMWFGAFCGGVYLVWIRKPWAVLALPLLAALVLLADPFALRERAFSSFAPHGAMDSNSHKAELREIGWEMVKRHPWLGVGPEQVSRQFQNYLPPGETSPRPGEYYGHLENDYIQYAAERGVPTMLALIWMIGWALRDFVFALRHLSPGRQERWILHAAIATIIAVLVSGWDSWNLNDSSVLAMFLAVLGMGCIAVRQSRSLLPAKSP